MAEWRYIYRNIHRDIYSDRFIFANRKYIINKVEFDSKKDNIELLFLNTVIRQIALSPTGETDAQYWVEMGINRLLTALF